MENTTRDNFGFALSIAGFDPTGMAGILADIRTFEDFGFQGCAILTALTVQSPNRVFDSKPVPARMILQNAEALAKTLPIRGIKIGMLRDRETVDAVAQALDNFEGIPVVLDPVLAASDDTPLLDQPGAEAMITRLIPRSTVITPNVPETEKMTGIRVENQNLARDAGIWFLERGAKSVVIKGGHLAGAPIDYLVDEKGVESFRAERIDGPAVHGTGCAFSSALTAGLASGKDTARAILKAKAYMADLIKKRIGNN